MAAVIFRDRDKLSPRYIPPTLPHREEQISFIRNFFGESLSNPPGAYLKVLSIVGPAGSGKTCSVLKFGERVEGEASKFGRNLRHVYVNLKLHGGSRVILYRYLLEACAPESYSSSLSAEEMLRTMLRTLDEKRRYAVISLDEIDYFIRSSRDTSVVYDLTRLNEVDPRIHCNVVGVIFTARDMTSTAGLIVRN
ncbi:MAG: AAA family ATPase [Nitrososphaeria archaeon]